MSKLIIKLVARANLPTHFGNFKIIAFVVKNHPDIVALVKGNIAKGEVLVRVHSSCVTGDIFGSLRCDCGEQLELSLNKINQAGKGVILYLNQEGRGIGLANKIKAYALEDKGMDTVEANLALNFPADLRDYKIAADILRLLKVKKIILLTNNPDKHEQFLKFGLNIVGRESLEITPNKHNHNYLRIKKEKMRHCLNQV